MPSAPPEAAPAATAAAAPPSPPAPRRTPVQLVTPEGERLLTAHYDEVLAELRALFPVEARRVPTRGGVAHVLVAGPEGGRPLVVWHGKGFPGAHMLGVVRDVVAAGYRVYLPDQPCDTASRSEAYPVDPAGHGWGLWARDVLDGLSLLPSPGDAAAAAPPPVHLGMSFGGAVTMDIMAVAPEAVGAAVLLVPICLDPTANSFSSTMSVVWRVVLPILLYRMVPCALTQRWAGAAIMDDPSYIPPQILLTWRHMTGGYNAPPPPLFSPGDIPGFRGPAIAFIAEHDIFGGGERVASRARQVIPGCETVVLPMKHAPTVERMDAILARALAFLKDKGFGPTLPS